MTTRSRSVTFEHNYIIHVPETATRVAQSYSTVGRHADELHEYIMLLLAIHSLCSPEQVLMSRDVTHGYTHREVVVTNGADGVAIQEIEDPVLSCNTDRVGTARSRKKFVIRLLFPSLAT